MTKQSSGLTKADVSHIAKLSKLDLTAEEITKFQKQLSGIVSYINELSEIGTEKTEPTSQTTGLVNVTRSDKVNTSRILKDTSALAGSGNKHNNYFVVPMVLENK